jgi:hypothetical protein
MRGARQETRLEQDQDDACVIEKIMRVVVSVVDDCH